MATTNTTATASGHSAFARTRFAWGPLRRDPWLEHEQDRAAEYQPRHEEHEVPVASPDQKQRPYQPAQSAGDEEQPQPQPGYLAQPDPGTPCGTRIGRKEGEGARCVGDHRRNDQGQHRKRYQPAPPASALIRPAAIAATKNKN